MIYGRIGTGVFYRIRNSSNGMFLNNENAVVCYLIIKMLIKMIKHRYTVETYKLLQKKFQKTITIYYGFLFKSPMYSYRCCITYV